MFSLFCRTVKRCEVVSDGMIFVKNCAEKNNFRLKIFGIETVTRTRALPRITP